MLISPLQILRERVAENIGNLFDVLRSPKGWITFIMNSLFKR
jgi:hypothetical protein